MACISNIITPPRDGVTPLIYARFSQAEPLPVGEIGACKGQWASRGPCCTEPEEDAGPKPVVPRQGAAPPSWRLSRRKCRPTVGQRASVLALASPACEGPGATRHPLGTPGGAGGWPTAVRAGLPVGRSGRRNGLDFRSN
jgi:hypothetical protein